MRRYLVVANQTILGGPLLVRIPESIAVGPCQSHHAVPASRTHAPPLWSEMPAPAFTAEPGTPRAADASTDVVPHARPPARWAAA